MSNDPKRPSGYPVVSPYLICHGGEKVIAFAETVLGGRLLRRFPAPDGGIMHAEIRIGDSVIMLGGAGDQWPAIPTHLHVYVTDVDDTYRRALEAGATAVRAPAQREGDEDRRGGVMDAGGNTWWFATHVG